MLLPVPDGQITRALWIGSQDNRADLDAGSIRLTQTGNQRQTQDDDVRITQGRAPIRTTQAQFVRLTQAGDEREIQG